MINKKTRGNILLFIAAIIWGTAFVAQKEGVGILHPCTYNGIRSFFGALTLLPVIMISDFKNLRKGNQPPCSLCFLITGGVVCGVLLFLASTMQTAALIDADEGKAGFMTALYLIIVPVLGIFLGRRIRPAIWISVILATVGLYCLCVKEGTVFSLSYSELLLLGCAFIFALHILAVDYFSPGVDPIKLSCLQFLTVGLISLVYIVAIDKPSLSDISSCMLPILYAGVMSSGIAYTLQIVAQKDTDPAVASIIMSTESLFALVAGMIFSRTVPMARELAGCAFMLGAIILVELPQRKGR